MRSSSISEAMQAANLFVRLQMTDLGECPSSEMKQCAGVTVDYEQNAFFFSPKCSKYDQLPIKTCFVELCAETQNGVKEQQAVKTLKGFTSISETRLQ